MDELSEQIPALELLTDADKIEDRYASRPLPGRSSKGNLIFFDVFIDRQKRHSFRKRLGYQQPVERVLVVIRQLPDSPGMDTGDR